MSNVMFRKMLPPSPTTLGPSPMARHAPNLGERHSEMQSSRAQCQRCRFKFVQGNFSIHWSGIHKEKKKQETKKKKHRTPSETAKPTNNKTRQNPCSVRAVLVASETRACYALSATWLAALDLTRLGDWRNRYRSADPPLSPQSVWPGPGSGLGVCPNLPLPPPPRPLLPPIQTKQAASLSP